MKFSNFLFVVLFAAALDAELSTSKLYTSDKNNVYYIEDQQQHDWFESLAACARMNMTILAIDSKSKSDEVNRLVMTTFDKSVPLWVGGYAIGPSRKMTWITTGEEFSYTFWRGNNPDFNHKSEFCVQIGWGDNMEWNDQVCTYKFGYICEYHRPQPSIECKNSASEEGDISRKYPNININFNNNY